MTAFCIISQHDLSACFVRPLFLCNPLTCVIITGIENQTDINVSQDDELASGVSFFVHVLEFKPRHSAKTRCLNRLQSTVIRVHAINKLSLTNDIPKQSCT